MDFDQEFNRNNVEAEILAEEGKEKTGKGKKRSTSASREADAEPSIRPLDINRVVRNVERVARDDRRVIEERLKEEAKEKENSRKRELLTKLGEWESKYQLPIRNVTGRSDLIDIEVAFSDAETKLAIMKGHESVKEGILSLAAVAEQMTVEYPMYLKLKGLTDTLRARPQLDQIVTDLCVRYSYLLKDIHPGWQLGFLVMTCAIQVHAVNSDPAVVEAVKRTEELRRDTEEPIDFTGTFDNL